jgi:KDO2-lipid IV(A) lauroyltransferase
MRPDHYRAVQMRVGRFKRIVSIVVGWIAVFVLRAVRRIDRKRISNFAGRTLRRIGPWLKEHRIGRANLAAAFPEKSPAEIERILGGVWENLGRVGAEFAHVDRLKVLPFGGSGRADVTHRKDSENRFAAMDREGRATLLFASHLANWEIPALVAAQFKVDACLLFRPPNIPAVAEAILKIREGSSIKFIPASFGAPVQLARALERGVHAGMLIDQHDQRGVDVTFFGRTCKASPLLAQLARLTGSPIRGIRVVRLPDGNSFLTDLTEPLDLPRDSDC